MRGSYIPLRTVGFRISVDTGGTFTDVVVADDDGTPAHRQGADHPRARLRRASRKALGADRRRARARASRQLLARGRRSSPTARRARRTRSSRARRRAPRSSPPRASRTSCSLREGGKLDPFRQIPYPPPYVPRFLTFEIARAHGLRGRRRSLPLDEDERRCARSTRRGRCGVEAVARLACSGRSSNPAHELRVGELIAEHLPDVPYTLSHQLNPIIREYRRASSTAIDASLKPLMQDYLATMERDLRAGRASRGSCSSRPRSAARGGRTRSSSGRSTRSAPARRWRPVAALTYAREELATDARARPDRLRHRRHDVRRRPRRGRRDQLHGGDVARRALDRPHHRHPLGRREVDRRRRRLDRVDRLRAGCSASARRARAPTRGPACYGRGGTEPTVTDAAVVLGYLDPDYFLGGRLPLDARRRARAIDASARRAARADRRGGGATRRSRSRARTSSARSARSRSPRASIRARSTLVAGGGASGLNDRPDRARARLRARRCCRARRARCRPAARCTRTSSPSSRAAATRRRARSTATRSTTRSRRSRRRRTRSSPRSPTSSPIATRKEFCVEARYRGQVWELDVPMPAPRCEDGEDVARAGGGVPRRPRARLRGARAGPVPRVPALEGARDGRARQADVRSRDAPAEGDAGAGRATPPRYFRGPGLARGAALRRRSACPPARASRARPSSASRRRRSSSIPARARTVTALGNYLLEVDGTTARRRGVGAQSEAARMSVRPRPARGHRQPPRLDRARDGEHAAAQRAARRSSTWRATSRARSSPATTACSPPPRACRST